MKKILAALLCLLSAQAWSSHIVGGEFEFLFKEYDGNNMRYSLNLILYFDLKNGNPEARDDSVAVRIFRKRDNAVMLDLLLWLSDETAVEYFQPECSSGSSIKTSRLYYRYRNPSTGQYSLVSLDPDQFDDPMGYYVSWERCCRNYNLTNIYSEDPGFGVRNAGQTFYLEFPSLKRNGQVFIDSSPRLFPPLADYACPNVVYYVDFSGSDDDGDSLVYSLSTPLSTHAFSPLPASGYPGTRMYPLVEYRPGFSASNVMDGEPDLAISWDGVLTVTPTVPGLFAFAVKVEEFRDKVKIGEVRRDFQMLVLTSCPTSQKPIVEAKHSGDADSEYGENITVNANDLCFDLKVYDPDSEFRRETVTLSAFLVKDRRRNITSKIISNSVQVLENGQPAIFTMCFPECPLENEQHVVGIIVSDKSCPLPRRDTVYVTVDFLEAWNKSPLFNKHKVIDIVTEGTEIPAWKEPFAGTDADGENLTITLDPETEFDPADYGFTLQILSNAPGAISAQLNWDTRCDMFDFSDKTEFVFSYILDDHDQCDLTDPDVISFDLKRDFQDFHEPDIFDPNNPRAEHIFVDQKIYGQLEFPVKGFDIDGDVLDMKGHGLGFNMSSVGASFPNKTFTASGEQTFTWRPDCNVINIEEKSQYDFELILVDDDNVCHYVLGDTLLLTVKVLPPDNIPPVLAIDGNTERGQKEFTVGTPFVLPIQGTDADNDPADRLQLELIGATGIVVPEGYSFESSPAISIVDGTFTWNPACEVFANGIYESDFVFTFKVTDDRCLNKAEDILDVDVHVKDRETPDAEFSPRPNVVTTNGDNKNDFFGMYKLAEDGTTLINILPVDNCGGVFTEIHIYNRWGRKVFTSNDREFKWYPNDESTGVYFYDVKYSNNREYNGWINVIGEASK